MSTYLFATWQNATSRVMLNGGLTLKFYLTRSVRQGCPLSPLLFAIVTNPLLIMLSNFVANGDIVGLHLPSSGELVAQASANDSVCFYTPQKKILKGVCKFGINLFWLQGCI